MFRPMRRIKQQLPVEEAQEVLRTAWRGVLAVHGDDGYPYTVPLDFVFDEETGHLFFHGASEGHKVDAIRKDDKVSFCVLDNGVHDHGDWTFTFRSVVIFGRMRQVEDRERVLKYVRMLGAKYYPTQEELDYEMEKAGHRVACYELIPEHMTCKRVHEQ